MITETLPDLRGHPADGGYVISRSDEVGSVLLQLELTQPLVYSFRVLITHSGSVGFTQTQS